jgi:putative FmdB family regulatory protein
MPIYEYKCAGCGKQIEAMQKVSDEPLRKCPHCHESKLEKQISLSGFQFKGSGWYVSDYALRGKDAKPDAKAEEKKSSNNGESTAKAPTASKTETKAD